MRKLLAAALVASLFGLAAADEQGAAPTSAPAKAESAEKAAAPKKKAKKGAAAKPVAQKPAAGKPAAAPPGDKPAEKPCEPVKPCPID